MKSTIRCCSIFILLLVAIILTACYKRPNDLTDSFDSTETTEPTVLDPIDEAIEEEMEAAFRFFWEQANTNPNSPGYGLIRDRYPNNSTLASIASVGFGLTAIPIGIEKGWITYEEGEERALGTLKTIDKLEHYHGFYYHFLNIHTGKRAGDSEVSSIDTALMLAGVLFVGEYFGGEIEFLAEKIYEKTDWNWFVDPNRKMFYMSYQPEKGFEGYWDFYAEQLIMYILGAGSPKEEHRMDPAVYYSFIRSKRSYGKGEPFIHSWFGSIFTYQFSHAWLDFRNIEDRRGVNWFENSVHATIAHRQYAIDNPFRFQTFNENSWGLTACDGPNGYSGKYGAPPSGYDDASHINDGTVATAGALGSIVFLVDEVKDVIAYFETMDNLKGDYGYKDSYNFEGNEPWISPDVIGIDKGIILLMFQNYQNEFVWRYFMDIKWVQDGLRRLEFKEVS